VVNFPEQNSIEPDAAKRNPDDQGGKGPPNAPPSETHIPAPIEDQPRAQERRSEIREWWKVIVETLTLLAVVWYACIASGQLKVMRDTVDKMKDQLWSQVLGVRTQRPVFEQAIRLPVEPRGQNDFKATVELKNVGPTPSVDLVESTQIWIATSEKQTSATWKGCPKVGVLNKSESVFCETPSLSASPDEVQAYQRKTSRLYVRVYAIYWDDIEGDFRHQQSMCLFHTFGEPLDHFNYCSSGNDVWHDNFQKRQREDTERPSGAPESSPN